MLSAAIDYEIGLRNAGDGVARDIQVELQMLSASAAQDDQVAAMFEAPVTRPAVAAFDLQPAQHIELSGMTMLPRTALSIITVNQRQLFVPILAIRVRYDRGGGEVVQAATAYVIGIDRGEGVKLAPFRADTGPRMFDTVSARAL